MGQGCFGVGGGYLALASAVLTLPPTNMVTHRIIPPTSFKFSEPAPVLIYKEEQSSYMLHEDAEA